MGRRGQESPGLLNVYTGCSGQMSHFLERSCLVQKVIVTSLVCNKYNNLQVIIHNVEHTSAVDSFFFECGLLEVFLHLLYMKFDCLSKRFLIFGFGLMSQRKRCPNVSVVMILWQKGGQNSNSIKNIEQHFHSVTSVMPNLLNIYSKMSKITCLGFQLRRVAV